MKPAQSVPSYGLSSLDSAKTLAKPINPNDPLTTISPYVQSPTLNSPSTNATVDKKRGFYNAPFRCLIMSEASRWMRVLAVSLILSVAGATSTRALSVTPSTNWYGDDGTWSAISIRVGSPPQWLDVFPSTVSSETWVVGTYGCDNNTICSSQRGGLFDLNKSTSWADEGFFYLQGDAQEGYGHYGLDDLTFGTTGVTIQNAIIASINETTYWLGEFGLGIVQGNFTNVTPLSAISNLVETEGVIPSHSYGFTAGATYQQKGETVSLTLGGYDANRFVPHNTTFELNPSQNPQAYIKSVFVSSAATSNNWTTPTQLLSTVDRVSVVIDSSTPYLWLPQSVCERFANSLGLTYNETLNTYTFDGNPAQHDVLENAQLTFTFSLSNIQSSTADVNITLPYEAFDLQLTYPAIPNTSYGAVDSSAYYFPLKQAANEAQYVIGRSFLQEAYIITDYERNTFSVHQAVHVADPIGNTSIIPITRPSDSTLSPPATSSKKGLSTGAVVGIVVAAAVVVALLCFAIFALCRHRRNHHGSETSSTEKLSAPPLPFLSRFRRRRGAPPCHEATGSTSYPTEVSADLTHERFELAAPLGPAELDSESGTLYGTTERGSSTQDSLHISAYERARRKLQRQQHSTSPLSPTTDESYPIEKSDHDISPVAHYRSEHEMPDLETPLVSPVGAGSSGGSLTISGTPSPVSPGFGSRVENAPLSPPPRYRRISPQNVVYAGRLPGNVQLPRIVPRIVGPDGNTIRAEQTLETEAGTFGSGEGSAGESSLGSLYTEMQEENRNDAHDDSDLYGSGSERGASAIDVGIIPGEARAVRGEDESKFLREDIQSLRAGIQTREILETVAVANRRRLDGEDLVHVPQPAENRFSWEEERWRVSIDE